MRNKKTRSQNSHKDLYREIERQEKKKHKDRESLLEQLAGRINLPADMTAGMNVPMIVFHNGSKSRNILSLQNNNCKCTSLSL